VNSNVDLGNYLARLADILVTTGEADLAENVRHARRFAIGSASEFLHEARVALANVHANASHILSPSQNDEVVNAIRKIDDAFKDVGGA
jgi:hypothetical protein